MLFDLSDYDFNQNKLENHKRTNVKFVYYKKIPIGNLLNIRTDK